MIALKNDYAAYSRSTDAKIRLLREVIEKVNNGEVVDVEKLLGTGNEAKEREWEEGRLHSPFLDILPFFEGGKVLASADFGCPPFYSSS